MRGEIVTNSMRQWKIACLVKEQKQYFLQVSELKHLYFEMGSCHVALAGLELLAMPQHPK